MSSEFVPRGTARGVPALTALCRNGCVNDDSPRPTDSFTIHRVASGRVGPKDEVELQHLAGAGAGPWAPSTQLWFGRFGFSFVFNPPVYTKELGSLRGLAAFLVLRVPCGRHRKGINFTQAAFLDQASAPIWDDAWNYLQRTLPTLWTGEVSLVWVAGS